MFLEQSLVAPVQVLKGSTYEDEPRINNRDSKIGYETTETSVSLRLHLGADKDSGLGEGGNKRAVDHIFLEVAGATGYTITNPSISNLGPIFEDKHHYTDTLSNKQVTLDIAAHEDLILGNASEIDLTITGNNLKIFRAYALKWVHGFASKTFSERIEGVTDAGIQTIFRDIEFEQENNRQIYESLYEEDTVINSVRQGKRTANIITRFSKSDARNRFQNLFELYPQFIFEYDYDGNRTKTKQLTSARSGQIARYDYAEWHPLGKLRAISNDPGNIPMSPDSNVDNRIYIQPDGAIYQYIGGRWVSVFYASGYTGIAKAGTELPKTGSDGNIFIFTDDVDSGLTNYYDLFPFRNQLPREIFRARFDGSWTSTYTGRNKTLGFDLTFRIKER